MGLAPKVVHLVNPMTPDGSASPACEMPRDLITLSLKSDPGLSALSGGLEITWMMDLIILQA